MKREREIIKLSEHESAPLVDYSILDDDGDYTKYFDDNGDRVNSELWNLWDNFEKITENINYYNLEDSFVEMITIIKRISDGKYFEANWIKYCYECIYPTELVEVFPKEVTTIIYE